jgi:hypothetical protein
MEHFLTDNPQTLGIMLNNLVPQDLCTPDVILKAYVTCWVHKFLCHQHLTVLSNTNEKIWYIFQRFYQINTFYYHVLENYVILKLLT